MLGRLQVFVCMEIDGSVDRTGKINGIILRTTKSLIRLGNIRLADLSLC